MVADNLKNNDRYTINSIEKALDLLELLAEKENLNLLELAELTNRPKSSLFRIITTLENRGYIARSENNDKYCLGLKILDLSKQFLEKNNIRNAALAEMNALLHKYGESVNLGILKDGEITYVEVLEGTHQLRFKDEVGSKAPFHATAMGKVILAYLSDEEMNQLLPEENMDAFTPYTIVDLAELKKQLPVIKSVGYAVDTQEIVLGVKCIAAPIFNMFGKAEAAISLSGTIHRIHDGNIDAISKDVVLAARNISRKMGFAGDS
ncbi:IclR family transcriptional regulator [Ammoniphilus resinae]|uniref:IclR family acetate operon transcriptional repressor n=1 Tax=Ammoniphilus resinae TaxID=861532 RepID=A0ABS4GTX6_9BACL|nr:IclR family transcriptional regulator [Ammoniphilus resinae]MBP1933325.1 IclR family acetate operon transcriptional repressor [Ammoniphilus resinae]